MEPIYQINTNPPLIYYYTPDQYYSANNLKRKTRKLLVYLIEGLNLIFLVKFKFWSSPMGFRLIFGIYTNFQDLNLFSDFVLIFATAISPNNKSNKNFQER